MAETLLGLLKICYSGYRHPPEAIGEAEGYTNGGLSKICLVHKYVLKGFILVVSTVSVLNFDTLCRFLGQYEPFYRGNEFAFTHCNAHF